MLGKGLPAGERQDGGDAGREREGTFPILQFFGYPLSTLNTGIGESGCLTESILDMELNMFKVTTPSASEIGRIYTSHQPGGIHTGQWTGTGDGL